MQIHCHLRFCSTSLIARDQNHGTRRQKVLSHPSTLATRSKVERAKGAAMRISQEHLSWKTRGKEMTCQKTLLPGHDLLTRKVRSLEIVHDFRTMKCHLRTKDSSTKRRGEVSCQAESRERHFTAELKCSSVSNPRNQR